MKNRVIIINIIILALITALSLIIILRYYSETPSAEIGCIEPRIDIKYESCYDILNNKISLKITNNENAYDLKRISLEFKDPSLKTFEIFPVPIKNSTEQYSFNSQKNPMKLTLKINLEKTPLGTCNESTKIIILKNCDIPSQDVLINLSTSDSSPESSNQNSATNTLPPKLVGKDELFIPSCKSNWACTGWEECINGIQRRDCSDMSKCLIPIDAPDFTRFCDGSCRENWQCEWSNCINGYTKPTCKELSNCNTEYSKPSSIPCNKNTACAPKIYCTDWSSCSISYTFEDLLSGIEELRGKKSRYCIDSNKCILPAEEEDYCSVKVDIITKEVNICGKNYLEVRDSLTGNLLSRVDYSKISDKLDINLFFSKEPIITC